MILTEVLEFLRETPPFQFLEEKILKNLAPHLSMEFYPKDTVILRQDDRPSTHLRIIKKGAVKVLIQSEQGEEALIDHRGERETFGLWSLMGTDRQRTSVIAVEDAICYLLPRDKVMELLDTNAPFTEFFLKSHLSRYLDRTYSEMLSKSMYFGGSDRLLFSTQVADVATRDVISIAQTSSIQEAAVQMAGRRVSSILVLDDQGHPTGVVTDRDLREKVVATGLDIQQPVRSIMSFPLISVEPWDYCFDALLKMIRHNIHHLLILQDNSVQGVLTNHDLMMLQSASPLTFAKDIEAQQDLAGLAPVSGRVNKLIGLLLKEGAKASNITRIINELNDRIVQRVLEFAERECGPPPVPYCWIAFGSEGRKEQAFRTDQDNAIVYATPTTLTEDKACRDYFGRFSAVVDQGLKTCGFAPCFGRFTAANPRWRQSLKDWERTVSTWINTPNPENFRESVIFFDFRTLHGDASLARRLRTHTADAAMSHHVFLAYLAQMAVQLAPPLGFFKTFTVEKSGEHKDRFNVKFRCITPIVDVIRLFSLEKGVTETSTLERLDALRTRHALVDQFGEEIRHAFEFVLLLKIHHHLEQMEKGVKLDNYINPDQISHLERNTLKEVCQLISKVQEAVMTHHGLTIRI